MQSINYTVGNWRAEARVGEVEGGNLMAIISLGDEAGSSENESKHTVVFEHVPGEDLTAETEIVVRHIIEERYGS